LFSTLKALGTKPAGILFKKYLSELLLRIIKVSGYWQNAGLAVSNKTKAKRMIFDNCLVLEVRFDGDFILFPDTYQI
jgi:hypothetical protein